MLFALLALATPRIGPPPNTGPFKPALKPDFAMELEDDDSAEFGFPSASGGLPGEGLPGEGLPGEGLLGSTLAGGGVMPGCCGPGVGPSIGPLFKLMSV